jgi:acetylornithine deacetylase/succinyl-diaminopimelate desuccinylase-like protein
MTADSQDVMSRIERQQEQYLEELKEYLRIPSVSTDPEHKSDVVRCSEFAAEKLKVAGLEVESIDNGGNPLIYAEWTGAPGKPTILFYGHYDVQPADPLDEWDSPPFEPMVQGDLLIARGSTDDKGQSYTHIKAVEAMLQERGELPVNVKFILEGEEEVGGESIEKFVREDAGGRLACDAVVVSDTSMFAPGQPSLLYGLKGLAYMEIKVSGPNRDLHSGSFGGAVTNPGNALCQIIAGLHDPATGRILIPGFYDDVLALADWEREEFGQLPFDENEYKADLGVSELFGEQGYSTLERTWARPTLDVNGLTCGYQGEGAKTVLPARASAKVSMRLVPNQDPEKIAELFVDYARTLVPAGVEVDVTSVHGAQPVLIDIQGPIAEAAMAAQEDIFGARPVRVREGGSIPIVASFSEVLGVPTLLMGFGLPDDRLHAPNEKFNISNFYGGIRAIVRLLDRAAEDSGT